MCSGPWPVNGPWRCREKTMAGRGCLCWQTRKRRMREREATSQRFSWQSLRLHFSVNISVPFILANLANILASILTSPANISVFILLSPANILALYQPCCICSVSQHFNFCLPYPLQAPPCSPRWPRRHRFMAKKSKLLEVAEDLLGRWEGKEGRACFWTTQDYMATGLLNNNFGLF